MVVSHSPLAYAQMTGFFKNVALYSVVCKKVTVLLGTILAIARLNFSRNLAQTFLHNPVYEKFHRHGWL